MASERGENDLREFLVSGDSRKSSKECHYAGIKTSENTSTSSTEKAAEQIVTSDSDRHCLQSSQSSHNQSTSSSITNKFAESGEDRSNEPGNSGDQEMVVGRSVKTRVLERINGGSFGEIHLGILLETCKKVAVKLEKQNSPSQQLLNEGNILRHLEGGVGIPKVHWFGIHEPEYNVMVMDLLGPSLQDLFSYCKHKFTLKTVLMLADQMLDIMKYIHKKQYIYRDVKPDNFMIGRGENSSKVYIIDFGLAKKITSHRFSVGHSSNIGHPLVGTIRYTSLHAHRGHDESPRDDVESLAYVFIYFLRGRLPWQGIPARSREERFTKIMETKQNTSLEVLCKDLPPQFAEFLDTARQLRRESMINYRQVKETFQNLAKDNNITYDDQFDWVIRRQETGLEIETRTDHGHDSI